MRVEHRTRARAREYKRSSDCATPLDCQELVVSQNKDRNPKSYAALGRVFLAEEDKQSKAEALPASSVSSLRATEGSTIITCGSSLVTLVLTMCSMSCRPTWSISRLSIRWLADFVTHCQRFLTQARKIRQLSRSSTSWSVESILISSSVSTLLKIMRRRDFE